MGDEDNSDVKEIENSFDTNPPEISEKERSVETVSVTDVEDVVVIPVVSKENQEEINEVPKPQVVTLRRHSTGTISKPQVQSRYRGNHHVGSTHDSCKHGKKKCDDQDDVVAVKPWKMVRRKSVEGSVTTVKVETSSGLRRTSLGSVSRQIPSPKHAVLSSVAAAKRDALSVKKTPCASVNSESGSSVKEDGEMARSLDDGSSVKSNDKAQKNKGTVQNTLTGSSSAVKKVPGSRNDKSRIRDGETCKVVAPKNVKNKEKVKTETADSNEDHVKEKTVCVVESSVKGVQRLKQPLPEKKALRSGHKSLTTTTPKRGSANTSPTKQIPGKFISTGLTTKKKETVSAANPKPETKVRPKKTVVKVQSPTKQLNFKRGKVLEPKPEDSSPRWMKFKKRVVQELKTQSEGRKKNLKDKRLAVEAKTDPCESSKREKVVLRHRKVEGNKKMVTLFNSVIEETMIKLTKVRKHKVKALIGAFETVISLQDTKPTSQKSKSKATTSASKVSPMAAEQ